MTVIAYKNGVMACDGSITSDNNSIVADFEKIMSLPDGGAVGFAGNAVGAQAAMQWLFDHADDWESIMDAWEDDGMPYESRPTVCSWDRMILLVTAEKRVIYFSGDGRMEVTEQDYVAIGSGASLAMGAMHNGGDAIAGVDAAIAHDAHCSGVKTIIQIGGNNAD